MGTVELSDIICSLDMAVLVRTDENTYTAMGTLPDWLDRELSGTTDRIELSGIYPYLEAFLPEAETFWDTHRDSSVTLTSDIWTETGNDGIERHYEASALTVKGEKILIIKSLGKAYDEKLAILQKAREKFLEFEKLAGSHDNLRALYDEMMEYIRL